MREKEREVEKEFAMRSAGKARNPLQTEVMNSIEELQQTPKNDDDEEAIA